MLKDITLSHFCKTRVWGLFATPKFLFKWFLVALPFILLFVGYHSLSQTQTELNPKQKIYPSFGRMVERVDEYLFEPDKRISYKEKTTANEKIEAYNATLSEADKESGKAKELVKKSDYDEWKVLNKEYKKINKSLKEGFTWDLFMNKVSMKFKMIKLGFTDSLMFNDSISSLYRLSMSMLIASGLALFVSLYMGLYKPVENMLLSFTSMYSLIQPVAILPIIMIFFGVEDYGKIWFVVIGVFPAIVLALHLHIKAIPIQTIVKSKTLGASDTQTVFKVVLPQILPYFINTVRLTLFLGWMLVLTSEMISAESGLGFRIMLEKRYVNMDVIIPYVVLIVLLSYSIDRLLLVIRDKISPWYKTR